jgi:hypothetical protein
MMADQRNQKQQDERSDATMKAEDRIMDNNEDPAPWRPADISESRGGTTKAASASVSHADKNTGDPGRTPGSAEGVEDFDKAGNE